MKQIKKHLIIMGLLFSFILLMPVAAMASETPSTCVMGDVIFYDENLDAVVANPFQVENGVVKRLTEEEFRQWISSTQYEESSNISDVSPRSTTWYRFDETSRSTASSPKSYTVSASVPGGSTITISQTVTITSTISGNLTADMIRTVKAALGASYTESASSEIAYNVPVPSSYKFGQLMFTPKIRTITGTVVTLRTLEGQIYPDEIARTPSTITTPVKTDSGYADGFFWVQETQM